MKNIELDILHDHYKESFLYIREREKQRDRLFLFVIALIGVLFIETQYSDIFPALLESISLESAELDLSILPISIFLSVTWTYLFVVVLKYYKTSINIERQYGYLHALENKISKFFKDKRIYCREGKSYLDNYPDFSKFVWAFYTLFFPIILILSIFSIINFEYKITNIAYYHLIYDILLACGLAYIVVLFILYGICRKTKK